MSRKHKKRLARIIIAAVTLAVIAILPIEDKIKAVLFLFPYLIVGWDVLWSAVKNIVHGQVFDENFLMSLATVGAYALGDYVEAAAVMLFYQVGELFQSIAVGKSRKSIAALMDIRPDSATVLRNGEELKVSPEEVQKGETVIVRAGEKIPLDGIVLEGETSVNTAALTGESLPRDVSAGDRVVSGAVNLSGVITVKTESVYRDSTVAKILDLVENSSAKKAKTENFITRFARYYTPCVVTAAVLLAVLPPLISGGGWTDWLQRALIFLVVSCPCALVISVPLSFFGGIGGASKRGILIKGANYTEVLSKVGTVVFDKTGTLTKGIFKVTAVHPESMSKAELLDVAAAAESYSNHPIAESVITAHGGHIDRARIGKVTEHAGMGVEAVIDNRDIFAGNGKLMDLAGAKWHDCHIAGTVIHISEGENYLGHIVISDEIKPDSKTAITALKDLRVTKTVMLTGDRKEIGEAVGKELGLDEVRAELLPDGKVAAVEKLLNEKTPLAFVGDGINDAPVLARADIGIAMGGMGSDAAIEAADVVLMDDKPSKLAEAIKIARKTMSIVWQNIIFALAVKAVVLVLGAAGFAGMWLAIFADVGVTVLAILNAMRAMRA
ncbi:MAG: heavy metal translocating P-type ATPase [Acutalibacteraceae bacterium]